jgi:mRNA interferase RelE/StbE
MSYEILYVDKVVKIDIPKISSFYRIRIKHAIEVKLVTEPHSYGKPLRKSLKGYLKLRVGDHRIVFRIENNQVKIFAIAHRKIIYKIIQERI